MTTTEKHRDAGQILVVKNAYTPYSNNGTIGEIKLKNLTMPANQITYEIYLNF